MNEQMKRLIQQAAAEIEKADGLLIVTGAGTSG